MLVPDSDYSSDENIYAKKWSKQSKEDSTANYRHRRSGSCDIIPKRTQAQHDNNKFTVEKTENINLLREEYNNAVETEYVPDSPEQYPYSRNTYDDNKDKYGHKRYDVQKYSPSTKIPLHTSRNSFSKCLVKEKSNDSEHKVSSPTIKSSLFYTDHNR